MIHPTAEVAPLGPPVPSETREKGIPTPEPRVLLTGLAICESPRWRDDRLWFANWGAQKVVAVDTEGDSEVVARVPAVFPFCVDRLPEGDLLVVLRLEARPLRRGAYGTPATHADLGDLAGMFNEIVVDSRGNAYVDGGDSDFETGAGAENVDETDQTGQVLVTEVPAPRAGLP